MASLDIHIVDKRNVDNLFLFGISGTVVKTEHGIDTYRLSGRSEDIEDYIRKGWAPCTYYEADVICQNIVQT